MNQQIKEILDQIRPQIEGILKEENIKMDYSIESINQLENVIRGTMDIKDINNSKEIINYTPYILYLGDTLIKHIPGSQWTYGPTPDLTGIELPMDKGSILLRPFHIIVHCATNYTQDPISRLFNIF